MKSLSAATVVFFLTLKASSLPTPTSDLLPRAPAATCPPVDLDFKPTYIPDSEDCNIFYVCGFAGISVPLFCPPNLEFNPDMSMCDSPATSRCTAED